MKKVDVIEKLAEVREISKKEAYANTVIDVLKSDNDEKITFSNLGTFKVKKVNERRGKIQMGERKGEEYVTPEHQEITFKISKGVKVL